MALPAPQRLRHRRDFDAVFQRGRKTVHGRLIIWSLPREDGSQPSRLGLSVSRKVGNAVQRNRVKRVLREAWAVDGKRLPQSVDAVVLARPGRAPTSLADAQRALVELIERMQRPDTSRPRGPRRRRNSAKRGRPDGRAQGSTSAPKREPKHDGGKTDGSKP